MAVARTEIEMVRRWRRRAIGDGWPRAAAVWLALVLAAVPVAVAQPAQPYALARERAAVIAAVTESFGRRPETVRRVGRDRWSAVIGGCVVEAFIRTKPVFGRSPPPGPRRIEVLLDRKACPPP